MADSTVQLSIAKWVRERWLPQEYNQPFFQRQLTLTTGGKFDFNAVSADGSIVAYISTSRSTTSRGNQASAKIQKLRSDMLFLLLVPAKTRLIVLTEKDMFGRCLKEKKNGRVPLEIQFVHAEIPEDLKSQLLDAQKFASDEVTPKE